ncbi:MAG: Tol-Pal system beta propeller repeat protein TolB [Candidatus Hydrogenedentes bacterium]|nr:Tol-Pal system beta propeller repeat protein TolB [Candidatus Hydrogenedentota bacterium]
MKSLRLTVVVNVIVFAIGGAGRAADQPVRITTEGAIDKRIPIAVPDFAAAPGQEALGKELAQVVTYDLEFTGSVTILPRESYPKGFTGFTSDATHVDFEAWKKTGIEQLVYAYVTTQSNRVSAECRLFDVLSGNQVVGKKFEAEQKWLRLVAHQFSDEIVRYLTGVPGIATSQICFSAGPSGKKEVYMADYDGANLTQVTKHNSISIMPCLSPDGGRIAYLSYKDRYPFLYILNLASGASQPLSKKVGLNCAPTWAPDGNTLAIVLSKDANVEVYRVNADGSGAQRLTNDRAIDTSPSFSPSGNEIAFASERSGATQIFVMSAEGGNVRRVSYQGGKATHPVWSPDGKLIAYVVERSGSGIQIYVMDASGANPRQLTASGGTNESPSWSADSRHLVFASTRTGQSQLWTVNVETGEQRAIPNLNLRCEGPSWGPRRE